jgi:hypothetical protein
MADVLSSIANNFINRVANTTNAAHLANINNAAASAAKTLTDALDAKFHQFVAHGNIALPPREQTELGRRLYTILAGVYRSHLQGLGNTGLAPANAASDLGTDVAAVTSAFESIDTQEEVDTLYAQHR